MAFEKTTLQSSLYRQIIILIILVSVSFFVLLAVVVFNLSRNYMEMEISRSSTRVSMIVKRALRQSMQENDVGELQGIMESLAEMPGIGGIRVFDHEGVVRHSAISSDPCGVDPFGFIPFEGDVYADLCAGVIYEWSTICESEDGRQHGSITSIPNEPSCSASACHVHPPDVHVLGFLQVQTPLKEMDDVLRQSMMNYTLVVASFLFVFTAVVILFTQKTINQPLRHILSVSAQVTEGNWSVRLKSKKYDHHDMRRMGEAFNQMLASLEEAQAKQRNWSRQLEGKVLDRTEELKRTPHELLHIERMASLGKLSFSVAHEINNPLAGILTYAKLMGRYVKDQSFIHEKKDVIISSIETIQNETMRCGNIVMGLLDFSREDPQLFRVIAVNAVLEDTARLLEHSFKVADVRLTKEFKAHPDLVRCNANQIKQACMAILVNAQEAVEVNGQVDFRSTVSADGKLFLISITDNGTGIRPEDIEHIFEPFFSRKQKQSGIGLGLAVTYGIIKQHEGKIDVQSELGEGTTFTIELPLVEAGEDLA